MGVDLVKVRYVPLTGMGNAAGRLDLCCRLLKRIARDICGCDLYTLACQSQGDSSSQATAAAKHQSCTIFESEIHLGLPSIEPPRRSHDPVRKARMPVV